MKRAYTRPFVVKPALGAGYIGLCSTDGKPVVLRTITENKQAMAHQFEWHVGPFKTMSAAKYALSRFLHHGERLTVAQAEQEVRKAWLRMRGGKYEPISSNG